MIKDPSRKLLVPTYKFQSNSTSKHSVIACSSSVLGLALTLTISARAITFQEIQSFPPGPPDASPNGLVQAGDGFFYGTTANAGSGHYGTVFRLTTNGVMTQIAALSETNGSSPQAALVDVGNGVLYGTTYFGGSASYGTVCQV